MLEPVGRRASAWLARLICGALMVALFGHGLPGMAAENDVVLIANPQLAIGPLPRDTARAIFAMRQRTSPSGQALHVMVLPDAHPVHARFAKGLLDVYPHQLRLAWDRMVFSGTGQAPERVASQAEMLKQVATTPGGLGYIERGYLDDSVHVLPLAE
ncbi:hypothetical protein [Modicisalibacter radicis]|uniref:hypothetical protein n=1 Tax=Halomonas sp. EAR18 TaxID=2518972 RepID=UPI0032AF963A